MAQWLDAHSYETKYRPIPIEEHIVCNGSIYGIQEAPFLLHKSAPSESSASAQRKAKASRKVLPSQHKELADPVLNAVVTLAHETAVSGYGVLVFAGSRATCESDARLIARVLPPFNELASSVKDKRMDILGELRSLSTGVDHVLEETVLSGVAFHR